MAFKLGVNSFFLGAGRWDLTSGAQADKFKSLADRNDLSRDSGSLFIIGVLFSVFIASGGTNSLGFWDMAGDCIEQDPNLINWC